MRVRREVAADVEALVGLRAEMLDASGIDASGGS